MDTAAAHASSEVSWCMIAYGIIFLWAVVSKAGIFHEWATEHSVLAIVLFLFVIPSLMALFKVCG